MRFSAGGLGGLSKFQHCVSCGSRDDSAFHRMSLETDKKQAEERPDARSPWLWLAAGFFLAGALLFYHLSTVAGLHRDEVAFANFARRIAFEGLRPLSGFFNEYTAPIHSYIIALTFWIFGESVFSLRASGVLLNLVSLFVYYDFFRRLVPKAALPAFWLLLSFPLFVIFARISGENYALNPLFVFGGGWFFLVGYQSTRLWVSYLAWALSGLFFYYACWNHIIAVPTVASVGLVYLAVARPSFKLILRFLPWMALGGLFGMLPKLYSVLILHKEWLPMGMAKSPRATLGTGFLNCLYTLGGDALYVRATGAVLFSVLLLLPFAALLSFWPLTSDPSRKSVAGRLLIGFGLCAVVSFLGSWYVTPGNLLGARIWLLPLWFVPGIIALGLSFLPGIPRYALLAILVSGNLLAVGANYFYPIESSGVRAVADAYVGGFRENSFDFVDFRPLVKNLRTLPDDGSAIWVEDYNSWRMAYLMPEAKKRIKILQHGVPPDKHFAPGTLIVLYRVPSLPQLADGGVTTIGASRAEYLAGVSTPTLMVLRAIPE